MSGYGDNYAMCNTDEQREAYVRGFNDGAAGQDNTTEIAPLLLEFYQFGLVDGSNQ
jgi:hypothetical protein